MQALNDYFAAVRERPKYDPLECSLGDLPRWYLQETFPGVVGHSALEATAPDDAIVTTGIGMSGPPHVGVVGQILTAIELQRLGYDVQYVLADLEMYHGGADLDEVQALAERYREFILELGFDADAGTLRTQAECREVMHTANVLAPYYDDEQEGYDPHPEPFEWEETASEASSEVGRPVAMDRETSDAALSHSVLLHLSDFVHPLLEWGYETAIVMLGMDEHRLSFGGQKFLESTPVDGSVVGLHTTVLPGRNGFPKMSKSIPESVVDVSMRPEEIRRHVVEFEDEYERPEDSTVYRMMSLASTYSPEELERMRSRCAEGGQAWQEAREQYADQLVEISKAW